jgi:membrane-bound lytic murein transglycosylase D
MMGLCLLPLSAQAGLAAQTDLSALTQPFPLLPGLEKQVLFWRDIFSLYQSNQVVVHDSKNIRLVWKVLDVSRFPKTVKGKQQKKRYLDKNIKALKSRLKRLRLDPKARDKEDERILALVRDNPEYLIGALKHIRKQRGLADEFRRGFERRKKIRTTVRALLQAEGVPLELDALPFVESMYNPKARSHVGAAGIWQFMRTTARWLGLKVSRRVDERLNITKATKAAAKLLNKNHKKLKEWPLAITAYNHGQNGMRRAVEKTGTTDLVKIIATYKKQTWGFASKNFYAEFLAALSVMREMEQKEVLNGSL